MLRDRRGGRMRPDDDRQGNQEEPDRLQGRFQGAEQDPVQKAWQVALRVRRMQAQVHFGTCFQHAQKQAKPATFLKVKSVFVAKCGI